MLFLSTVNISPSAGAVQQLMLNCCPFQIHKGCFSRFYPAAAKCHGLRFGGRHHEGIQIFFIETLGGITAAYLLPPLE